jgi:hypothetical protein
MLREFAQGPGDFGERVLGVRVFGVPGPDAAEE